MVILGGEGVSYERDIPVVRTTTWPHSSEKETPVNGLEDCCPEATSRIWPRLTSMCHVRTAAAAAKTFTHALFFYKGTSLIRNHAPLGLYSRSMPNALGWSYGAQALF